jgi:hypothetical protein
MKAYIHLPWYHLQVYTALQPRKPLLIVYSNHNADANESLLTIPKGTGEGSDEVVSRMTGVVHLEDKVNCTAHVKVGDLHVTHHLTLFILQ